MSIAPANDASSAEDLAMEEALSAWMDGEFSHLDAERADLVSRWKHDPDARACWSTYHCIGDSLRSPELSGLGDDARFLAVFRARLAKEPVILAPQKDLQRSSAGAGRWAWAQQAARRWTVPVGIAAGVAMVSSAVWLTQTGRQDSSTQLSSFSTISPGLQVTGAGSAVPMERFRVGERSSSHGLLRRRASRRVRALPVSAQAVPDFDRTRPSHRLPAQRGV